MKVCIIGNGLTSLTLAKTLVNLGIYVDVISNIENKNKNKNKNRTIGISKSNVEFFNQKVFNINKYLWNINKIEVFSQNFNNQKILDFGKNDYHLFSMIKNDELLNYLSSELKKNKLFNIKKKLINFEILNKDYKLIFNCDPKNKLSKKFFSKKINKDYKSFAHVTIINHKKTLKNDVASQIFTKSGPLAFLPMSQFETSVVYSSREKENINLREYINKFNQKYKITKINKPSSFSLKSSNLRNYRHKNMLAFGDLMHKIHPLAGQGFNMSLRDIRVVFDLINSKIKLGLDLDSSIFLDFEKRNRHKNYIFANSIDFVYEFFTFESKIKTKLLSKSVKILGKNKFLNKFFTEFADKGILS